MKYICVDESGSYNSTYENYYVISGIVIEDLSLLEKLHLENEKILREIKHTNKELKAARLKDHQKAMFVNSMIENDVKIISLAIDKKTLHRNYDFIMSEFLIYNYALKELTKFAIEVGYLEKFEKVLFHVDGRIMNPKIYYDLESYLNLEFYHKLALIRVSYLDSAKSREIQMADYVSNIIHGHLNQTNHAYEKLISHKHIRIKIIPKE